MTVAGMIHIEEADSPRAIEEVSALFSEYQAALGLDLGFQGFAEELAGLPGAYARPRGRLLLARSEGVAVGCAGLRPFDTMIGEIKRLYVRPSARGHDLGRRLTVRLIEEARAIGYERLYLDTLPSMSSAQRLYESLGFRDVPPYRYNPVEGTRFLALEL